MSATRVDLVEAHMTRGVVTVMPDLSLADAAAIFLDSGISGAPVVDDSGAVVGVLSQFDFLFKEAGSLTLSLASATYQADVCKMLGETVRSAMTSDPITVAGSATMQEAAALMLRRNLNRVLVTHPETNCLIGIVSSTDIFRLAFEDGSTWK